MTRVVTHLLPDPSSRKLGRQVHPKDPRDLKLASFLTAAKPVPRYDWTRKAGQFPMLLNDRIGDCVVAGGLHMVQMWAANAGNPGFAPTDDEALALYEHFGYRPGDPSSDNGINPDDFLSYWRKNGIAGHRILGWVDVDPTNDAHMKLAGYLGGGVFAAWQMPVIAQAEGDHWKLHGSGPDARPGSWGGHLAPLGAYGKPVTWGAVGTVTVGFRKRYCDYAKAVISPDWMDAAGVDPTGLDLAALQQAIQAVTH